MDIREQIERLRTELAINPEDDWTPFARDLAGLCDNAEKLLAVYEAAKGLDHPEKDGGFTWRQLNEAVAAVQTSQPKLGVQMAAESLYCATHTYNRRPCEHCDKSADSAPERQTPLEAK